ncbi:MAG: helix-turn-helix domain-containing protein [Oscillatoriaceae bacterium SKW80]|nr:helix-turn-helix domain-containing protein [Oscillatoriaceae bacterium SKW80]HIK28034.1 helix-turn-helix domain-containing protein [Oscillatoriaceae cyanobacterium M7585_C2015_266]
MTITPAAYPSVTNINFTLTSQELRALIEQIESELYSSEIYQRAVTSLQTLLGEAAQGTQIFIQAVAREAIALTLKYFKNERGEKTIVPRHPEYIINVAFNREMPTNPPENNCEDTSTTVAPVISCQNFTSQQKAEKTCNSKNSKKSEKEAAQAAEQIRQERIRQIGKELRLARQARNLSLEQLHRQTLVSITHIEALETGNLERLPEDVYIRGFIRRVADALGLDGTALVASIPAPDPVKSVVPSWGMHKYEPETRFYLDTEHLYLGYAALVVGTVGGLSLLSGQTVPGALAETNPEILSPAAIVQPQKSTAPTTKTELKSSHADIPVWSGIAPPEMQAF